MRKTMGNFTFGKSKKKSSFYYKSTNPGPGMYNITNYRSKIPFNRNSKLSTARSSAKANIKHFGETWTRDKRPY